MIDEMMSLKGLLEKTPDADLLREMIGFAAGRLIELEVGGLTGAGFGEKSAGLEAQQRLARKPCIAGVASALRLVGPVTADGPKFKSCDFRDARNGKGVFHVRLVSLVPLAPSYEA